MQIEKIWCSSKMDKDKTVQTAQVPKPTTIAATISNTPKVTESTSKTDPKTPNTPKPSNKPSPNPIESTNDNSKEETPNSVETPKKTRTRPRRSRKSRKTIQNTSQPNPENSEIPTSSQPNSSETPNPSQEPNTPETPQKPRRSRKSRKSRKNPIEPKDPNQKTPYQGEGRRFGKFRCPVETCKRFWCSAFSWANFGQQCRDCATGEMVYPFYQRSLWWRKDKKPDVKKPHHGHLCEKCIKFNIDCLLTEK